MSETKYDRWKTTAPDPYLEPEERDPDVLRDAERDEGSEPAFLDEWAFPTLGPRDAERDEPDYQDLACVDFEED